MALTLIEYPVSVINGITNNVFAGFLQCEIKFKREDLQIESVVSGIDEKIEVIISTDLTSYLNIGDAIHLYAVGDSGYIYDDNGEIIDITSTSITVNIAFIEVASVGYINYLKNYYVELRPVNSDNQNIKVLTFSLKDDGDTSGNIIIDVSIVNDKNKQIFKDGSAELLESRIKFNVEYRQVYEGSSESFVLIDDPIILVYATEQMQVEEFINDFEYPEIYKGYDSGVILCHSDSNNSIYSSIDLLYDELDLNFDNITTDNELSSFDANDIGFLFSKIPKELTFNANTHYIKIKGEFAFLPDYDSNDYDNDDYNT